MGKILAIKGHPTRGEEVIKLLEMLGGKNTWHYDGSDGVVYFIEKNDKYITYCGKECIKNTGEYIIYELEEFLEKYPYKVGDEFCNPYDKITEMFWDEEDVIVYYKTEYSRDYVTATDIMLDSYARIKSYKEEINTEDNNKFGTASNPVETKSYTVGLKDGKVIECEVNKIKPLFKAGDVVKLKGDPDENLFWIVMDVVKDGYIFNDASKCSFDDQHHYEKSNRKVIGINEETITPVITTEVIDNSIDSVQFIQNGKIVAVHLNTQNYENEVELQLGDYEIEVRDGKTYAVLKKPKYPTTYAECCEVLVGRKPKPHEISFDKMELCLVDLDNTQSIDFRAPHLFQLNRLFRLLMCLDAYWKIAGEEMGLDKPWEPDWKDTKSVKYAITLYDNVITKMYLRNENAILVFPTEEMRDVFYKNFKHLIEQCKELL